MKEQGVTDTYIAKDIKEFIMDDHPCVMAQTIFNEDKFTIRNYSKMTNEAQQNRLLEDIKDYIKMLDENKFAFDSFIAVFKEEHFKSEIEFENALWKLLKDLNELDPTPWDPMTGRNTESKNFSYSLLGTSFYLVGMHPFSSRLARRSPYPLIVFNLHAQFEVLRDANRYKRVRNLIRKRDKAFQGSINPMMEDFGQGSEAKQYSGRKVGKDWKCPFVFK